MGCLVVLAIALFGFFISPDLQILAIGLFGRSYKPKVGTAEPPKAEPPKGEAKKVDGPARCRCGRELVPPEKRLCRRCDDEEADLLSRWRD